MSDLEYTLWCGNLSNRVTEEILYELFLQAGPLKRISLPKDDAGYPRSYAFITFKHECSLSYATALFSQTSLFNKPLLLKESNRSKKEQIVEPVEKMKEATCWSELSTFNEEKNYNKRLPSVGIELPSNEIGVSFTPDFNMLLQMGSQMFPQNLPRHGLDESHYSSGTIGYTYEMEDRFRNRREHHGQSHHYRPYNRDHHTNRHMYKESNSRDHGHPNNRHRESSNSHQRERRFRHY